MKEQWKTVEGHEEYAVSDLGRVKRIVTVRNSKAGKILKPFPTRKGYLLVELNRKAKQVHRLVAQAFLPNPLSLPEVNHLGDKTDNRAIKLEWRSSAGHRRDGVHRHQKGDGVHFDKPTRKWRAVYYPKPRKKVNIGRFSSWEEAKAARDKAVQTLPFVL